MKRLIRKLLPKPYEALRDLRWSLDEWYDESLRDHGPEKKAEFRFKRLAAGMNDKPVDPAKPRVLFLAIKGWPYHLLCEAVMALRLRQRGHHVEFVTCDRSVPFCLMGNVHNMKTPPCDFCMKQKEALVKRWFPSQSLGAFEGRGAVYADIDKLDLAGCRAFTWNGMPLGLWCESSVMWYELRSMLYDHDIPLFRQLLKGAVHVAERFPAHLDRAKPDRVVMLNGDFFAERVAREICMKRGIHVFSHETGFFLDDIYMRMDDSRPYYADETFDLCKTEPLTRAERTKVEKYFKSRRRHRAFWPTAENDPKAMMKELGLDDRPTAALFTNVTWDTAMLQQDTIYTSMHEWLADTVAYFGKHPEWQLIIRFHPGEVRFPEVATTELAEDELRRRVPVLPPNVKAISAHSMLSSYLAMDRATCGLVYMSTVGFEMTYLKKPTIVAAPTHYARKGFTYDPSSRDEYFDMLGRAMRGELRFDDGMRDKHLSYAYHFFFERLTPFGAVTRDWKVISKKHVDTRSLYSLEASPSGLRKGSFKGLETLCNAIERGETPIVGRRIAKYNARA